MSVTKDHPALKLLADTLSVTSDAKAPGLGDSIASILGHALEATGYDLVPKHEPSWALSGAGRVAVVAARSAVSDGREIGPNTVGVLLAELDRFAASGGAREVAEELLRFAGGEPDDPEQVAQWRQLLASMGVSLAELVVSAPVGLFDLLTGPQRRALREMLEEWVGDGFVVPPYSDAQYDIFEALGVQSSVYDTKRPG